MTTPAETALDPSSFRPHRELPLSAVIETALFFFFALAFDLLFFSGDRFASVAPHPFWLVVLVMALQYGTSAGLLAAVASTLALYLGNLPPQPLGQDIFDYTAALAVRPVAWLAAALVIGELRRRQLTGQDKLRQQLAESEKRQEELAVAYQRVRDLNERLETRISAQLQTAFTLFHAAQAVTQLDTGEVLLGISALVREVISPKKFSLFVLNDNRLEAVFQEGWEANEPYRKRFEPTSPFYTALVAQRRFLNIADPEQAALLAGEGLLAGPIVNDSTGQVLGVLKIEETGFLDLNRTTIENFRVICNWIGAAYAKAEHYESSLLTGKHGDQRLLMPEATRKPMAQWFRLLAQRTGIDLSFVSVRFEAQPDQVDDLLHHRLGRELLKATRTTDLVFNHPQERSYQILLAATPASGAKIFAEKLSRTLEQAFPAAKGYPHVVINLLEDEEQGP